MQPGRLIAVEQDLKKQLMIYNKWIINHIII